MDESCRKAHAKLISGTCPWCGKTIVNGSILENRGNLTSIPYNAVSIRTLVLSHGPIKPITAVEYTLGVTAELEAHYLSTPHRSICPETVLIDDSKKIHVVSAVQTVLHFADSLAPEQALNSYKADIRSDIYSLGCTLFFMLTARAPFLGNGISEVLLKHQIEVPVAVHRINPDVPESLANICQKMLAKKPDDRYQSINALRHVLTRWQNA
jgi:serine/threonine protein kinase